MGPLEDTRDSTLPGLLAHVSLRKNLITLVGQGLHVAILHPVVICTNNVTCLQSTVRRRCSVHLSYYITLRYGHFRWLHSL